MALAPSPYRQWPWDTGPAPDTSPEPDEMVVEAPDPPVEPPAEPPVYPQRTGGIGGPTPQPPQPEPMPVYREAQVASAQGKVDAESQVNAEIDKQLADLTAQGYEIAPDKLQAFRDEEVARARGAVPGAISLIEAPQPPLTMPSPLVTGEYKGGPVDLRGYQVNPPKPVDVGEALPKLPDLSGVGKFLSGAQLPGGGPTLGDAAKTLGELSQAYSEHVAQPVVGLERTTGFGFPGVTGSPAPIAAEAQAAIREGVQKRNPQTPLDAIKAIYEAAGEYERTRPESVPGLKALDEMVGDPLNLLGWGLERGVAEGAANLVRRVPEVANRALWSPAGIRMQRLSREAVDALQSERGGIPGEGLPLEQRPGTDPGPMIGNNAAGAPVFENEQGIRFVETAEGGFTREPVRPIRTPSGVIEGVNRVQRPGEFRTVEEIATEGSGPAAPSGAPAAGPAGAGPLSESPAPGVAPGVSGGGASEPASAGLPPAGAAPLSESVVEAPAVPGTGESRIPWDIWSTNDKAQAAGLPAKITTHPAFGKLKQLVDARYARTQGPGAVHEADPERALAYLSADPGTTRSPAIAALQDQIAADIGIGLRRDVGKFKGTTFDIPRPTTLAGDTAQVAFTAGREAEASRIRAAGEEPRGYDLAAGGVAAALKASGRVADAGEIASRWHDPLASAGPTATLPDLVRQMEGVLTPRSGYTPLNSMSTASDKLNERSWSWRLSESVPVRKVEDVVDEIIKSGASDVRRGTKRYEEMAAQVRGEAASRARGYERVQLEQAIKKLQGELSVKQNYSLGSTLADAEKTATYFEERGRDVLALRPSSDAAQKAVEHGAELRAKAAAVRGRFTQRIDNLQTRLDELAKADVAAEGKGFIQLPASVTDGEVRATARQIVKPTAELLEKPYTPSAIFKQADRRVVGEEGGRPWWSTGFFLEFGEPAPDIKKLRTFSAAKESSLAKNAYPSLRGTAAYSEAKPVGVFLGSVPGDVILSDGKAVIPVSLEYYRYFVTRHPRATFHMTSPTSPILVKEGRVEVGLVMPIFRKDITEGPIRDVLLAKMQGDSAPVVQKQTAAEYKKAIEKANAEAKIRAEASLATTPEQIAEIEASRAALVPLDQRSAEWWDAEHKYAAEQDSLAKASLPPEIPSLPPEIPSAAATAPAPVPPAPAAAPVALPEVASPTPIEAPALGTVAPEPPTTTTPVLTPESATPAAKPSWGDVLRDIQANVPSPESPEEQATHTEGHATERDVQEATAAVEANPPETALPSTAPDEPGTSDLLDAILEPAAEAAPPTTRPGRGRTEVNGVVVDEWGQPTAAPTEEPPVSVVPPEPPVKPPARPSRAPATPSSPRFSKEVEEGIVIASDRTGIDQDLLRRAIAESTITAKTAGTIRSGFNIVASIVNSGLSRTPDVQLGYVEATRYLAAQRERLEVATVTGERMLLEAFGTGKTKPSAPGYGPKRVQGGKDVLAGVLPNMKAAYRGTAPSGDPIHTVVGTLWHVLQRPDDYLLTALQKRAVETYNELQDSDRILTKRMGVPIGEVEDLYVKHAFKKPADAAAALSGRVGGQGRAAVTRGRKLSVEEYAKFAEDHNLEIELNVSDLLARRLGETAQLRANYIFVDTLAKKLGAKKVGPGTPVSPETPGIVFVGTTAWGGFTPKVAEEIRALTRPAAPMDTGLAVVNNTIDLTKGALLNLDFSVGGGRQAFLGFVTDPIGYAITMGKMWSLLTDPYGWLVWFNKYGERASFWSQRGLNLSGININDVAVAAKGSEKPFYERGRFNPIGRLNDLQFQMIMPVMKIDRAETFLLVLQNARNDVGAQALVNKLPIFGWATRKYGGRLYTMTDDELAKVAAEASNNTFGGIEWAKVGSSPSGNIPRKMLWLTEGWTRGQLGLLTRSAQPNAEGFIARRILMSEWLMITGISTALSLILSQKLPEYDPRSQYASDVRTPDGYLNIWPHKTMIRDAFQVLAGKKPGEFGANEDPATQRWDSFLGFAAGRLGNLITTGYYLARGRDFYNQPIPPDERLQFVLRSQLPIIAQSVIRNQRQEKSAAVTAEGAAAEFAGWNFNPYNVTRPGGEQIPEMGPYGERYKTAAAFVGKDDASLVETLAAYGKQFQTVKQIQNQQGFAAAKDANKVLGGMKAQLEAQYGKEVLTDYNRAVRQIEQGVYESSGGVVGKAPRAEKTKTTTPTPTPTSTPVAKLPPAAPHWIPATKNVAGHYSVTTEEYSRYLVEQQLATAWGRVNPDGKPIATNQLTAAESKTITDYINRLDAVTVELFGAKKYQKFKDLPAGGEAQQAVQAEVAKRHYGGSLPPKPESTPKTTPTRTPTPNAYLGSGGATATAAPPGATPTPGYVSPYQPIGAAPVGAGSRSWLDQLLGR